MKKRIILLVFLFFAFFNAFAQNKKNNQQPDTTPVQLQNLSNYDKKEIEKQHQKLLDENAKEFNDGDETFKPNTIPDKWKNESAVIIGQKAEYDYYPVSNGAAYDEIVRRKIMLLDNAAVDKFTTMTFIPDQEVGYRVIKKNGTIKNINTLNAVPIQDNNYIGTGPGFFIPTNYNVPITRYYKLAIPDLEPGDIFEYYYVNTYTYHQFYVPGTSVQMYRYGIPFPAIIFTLDEEYPIVKQREEFNIQSRFYVNYSATNGAPKFSEPEVVDKKTKLFAITDADREKKKDERWKYDFRSDPTIKFQVVYTTELGKDEMPYMLGDPFVPVTSVPHELLQGVANQIAIEKMDVSSKVAADVISYMHKNYKKLDDSVKYMKLAYYYLRYYMYVKKIRQGARGYDGDNIEALDLKNFLPDSRRQYLSDEFFIKTMGIIARNVGLEDEMIFGVPRNIGTLDNLILRGEMQWLTKIKGAKDILLYPCNGFSNPDEPMEEMEGTHDYSIIPNEKSAKVVMDETTIPVSPYANNLSSFKLDATLNSAMEGSVSVARNATIKGLQKEYYYPEVLIQEQYEDQEAKKFGDQTEAEYINHLSAKKKDAEVEHYNNYLNDEIKNRQDEMEDMAKEEYDIDGYGNFNLVCSGIEMDSTTLIFNDAFKV